MKKNLITVVGSAAVLALVTGCPYTYLASPEADSKTAEWEAFIRESYPDYTPPPRSTRTVSAAPAVKPAANYQAMPDTPAPQELPAEKASAEEIAEVPAEIPAEIQVPTEAAPEKNTGVEEKKEIEKTAEEAVVEVKAETAEQPAEEKIAVPDADPNSPPDPTNSTVYEVKSGDTLSGIAQRVYGNASFSNIIHKANMDILKNPDKLQVGMKLIIPTL